MGAIDKKYAFFFRSRRTLKSIILSWTKISAHSYNCLLQLFISFEIYIYITK